MTWAEFKKLLDEEIAEDEEVWYIDVTFPKVQDFEGGTMICKQRDYGVMVEN